MPLIINETGIRDVYTYDASLTEDSRGSFSRLFCEKELSEIIGARQILQINQSLSKNVGTVRGMHYQQPPYAEMKIVRCLSGRVFDVAVDIRKGSKTFLQWVGVELSAENNRAMIIPEGFAHGFQVLEPDSVLLYLHTNSYDKASEGSLHHADPAIRIQWPFTPCDLSEKDKNQPFITSNFMGVAV